jgi:hypothetical protein
MGFLGQFTEVWEGKKERHEKEKEKEKMWRRREGRGE